jgi:hypothetical protein
MPLKTGSSNTQLALPRARAGKFRVNWCTGEDSNLRSSQGAADLQSAAINHSATCAHSNPNQRKSGTCWSPSLAGHSLLSSMRRTDCRRPESPVPAIKEHPNVNLREPGKILQQPRDQTSARLTIGEAAAGFSSLGELRVSFGLLPLRLAARSRLRFWSWRRDLNPRPSDYKSDALPAELRQPAWLDP